MTQQTLARKKSHIVVGLVIAFGMALFLPVIMGLSTVIFAYPVMLVFLYVFSGMGVAIGAVCVMLLSASLYFGMPGMFMTLSAFALPAVVMIRCARWGRPFWAQMRAAIIAQILGVVGALAIAYAYVGGDIIKALVDYLMGFIKRFPPGVTDVFLSMLYGIEDVPSAYTAQQLTTGFLTEELRLEYLDMLAVGMNNLLALQLPGTLLTASALTGIFSTTWGNYMLRGKAISGEAPRYVSPGLWALPYQLVFGLTGATIAAYAIYSAGVGGGNAVFVTIHMILLFAFKVQAVASFERRFAASGMKKWLRALLIILGLLMLSWFFEVYGGLSTLLGTHSVGIQIRKSRSGRKDE